MALEVGAAKVVALEEQGSFRAERDRVGKAISHIEPGRMSASAIAVVCALSRVIVLAVEGEGGDVGGLGEARDDLRGIREPFCGQNHACFEQRRPTDQQRLPAQRSLERFGLRLVERNREDDGGVERDHCGSPCSS